jgi:hypothetical protein
MIYLNNEIVKPVIAAKPVAWFSGRPPERLVVTPVPRVLAPRVVRANPAKR